MRLLVALCVLAGLVPVAPAQPPLEIAGPAEYTVLLDTPSVGERLREFESERRSGLRPRAATGAGLMRRAVVRSQDPVIAAISAQGVPVIGTVQNVLNAVFVRATSAQADAIAALPGVRGVVRAQHYEPMLKSVSQIVRVSAARVRLVGTQLFGEGMKIGIIDSGLDFDHEAFRDKSLVALDGYPRGDSKYWNLTSTKVIAVRSYVDLLNSGYPETSTPDDNSPWDSGGHGTAVAMIAAGKRVNTPLGAVSGIAPKARIGVYKVFGTPGLNFYTADQAVLAALDHAVDDGMDIVNLSLGNPTYYAWDARGRDCGRSRLDAPCNPLAVAAQSLVDDFGMVVVAAAGNHGSLGTRSAPAKSSIIIPGTAPGVISVGGTGNSASILESVRVGSQSFSAQSGTGPNADGPLAAPALLASGLGDPQGCESYPANALSGKIAVIDRGNCFFRTKVEHADGAGAVAVVVVNHEGDDLVKMALLESTDIPAFFVGGSDGEAIRELIADPENELTLDPTPTVSDREWAYVAPRSSRGPNLALLPKPDLVAPGLEVYTAAPRYNDQGILFNPSGFETVSGTSFAAPVVTGAAAIVWQAYPSFTARQVASVLINSASREILEDDEPARLTSAGAGVLDIREALLPTATVVPPSIGFGSVKDSAFPVIKQIEVRNKSKRAQSFLLTVEPRDSNASGRVTVNGRSAVRFMSRPGGTSVFRVALEGSRPLPGSYEGRLRLSSLNGWRAVSVPYMYVVGDNEPYDALLFRGRYEVGIEGEESTETVVARIVDRFGVPVAGRRVEFSAVSPSATILRSSRQTGQTGLIFASVRYGPESGEQQVIARVGGLDVPFVYNAAGSRPWIESIADTATNDSTRGIAPGSLARISGSDFALYPSGPVPVPQVRRLPLSRKGITVAFDAPGIDVSVAGRIASVDENSVTVHVPWELAGAARGFVKVRTANHSEPFQFQLVEANPAVFMYSHGTEPFAAALRAGGAPVTVENPATPGEAVTILMTGNGPVQSPPPTGAAGTRFNSTIYPPGVWIGSESAEVSYSGLDPGMAGLYLVTARVPDALEPGNHSLRVEVNGTYSNDVLLPVQ